MRPIYIAGGSSEIDLCQRMIDTVIAAGGRITYDWTRDPGWSLGRPMTMEERKACACRDLAAVVAAPIFWQLMPREKTEGASAELGAALLMRHMPGPIGTARTVIVSGPMLDSRIFPAMAARIFERHEDALAYVLAAMRTTAGKH